MLKKQSNKLFKIAIILILIATAIVLTAVTTRGYFKSRSFIGGDEPHYVMMADSLLKDKDFNLKNDYELNRSIQYYGEDLFPHLAPIIDYKNSNNWYSIHTIGLPLIIYLPYKLAGVFGVRSILMILQLAAVYVFYLVLKKSLNDHRRSFIGLVLLASCSIFWQNFGGIFPDILLVMFFGLFILLFGKRELFNNTILSLLFLLSVLTHSKSITLLVPIYIAHYLYLASEMGPRLVFQKYWSSFAILIFSLSLYVRFLFVNYGVILPSQLYGVKGQLFSANILYNLMAILFDKVKGVIIYFPVLVVSGPYIYRAIESLKNNLEIAIKDRRLEKKQFLFASIVLGLFTLIITQLGFDDWSGSFAPNGRYMLIFIFVIIYAIAKYLNFRSILEKSILSIFITLNFLITFIVTSRVDIYFDTGKETFLSQKLLINTLLPTFGIAVKDSDLDKIIYTAILFIILILLNMMLINLYKKNEK